MPGEPHILTPCGLRRHTPKMPSFNHGPMLSTLWYIRLLLRRCSRGSPEIKDRTRSGGIWNGIILDTLSGNDPQVSRNRPQDHNLFARISAHTSHRVIPRSISYSTPVVMDLPQNYSIVNLPRLRVTLRLAGFLERTHSALRAFVKGGQPSTDIISVCRTLNLLRSVLQDEDVSIHAAQLGMHATLAQLAAAGEASVSSAASEAIVSTVNALPPEWGFPRKCSLDDDALPDPPFVFPCGAWAALPPTDADLIGDWLPSVANCDPDIALHHYNIPDAFLRVVPSWVHKLSGQEHVGQLLWPAAVILSRWLAANRAVLQGRVLELGSGQVFLELLLDCVWLLVGLAGAGTTALWLSCLILSRSS